MTHPPPSQRAMANADVIVQANGVSRVFAMPAGPVVAVREVSVQIRPGDHIAVQGPSGCGKSTLLHMLGCVDTPSSGSLFFDGQDVGALSDNNGASSGCVISGSSFSAFSCCRCSPRVRTSSFRNRRRVYRRRTGVSAPINCSTTSGSDCPRRSSAVRAIGRGNAARGHRARIGEPAATVAR